MGVSRAFLTLASLFLTSTHTAVSNAQQIRDSPEPRNFARRIHSSATLIGDYVYIEGGLILQKTDGINLAPGPSYGPWNTVNNTLSIDMRQSWSSDSVAIRTIQKPAEAQPRAIASLLVEKARGEYYLWGGFAQNRVKVGVDGVFYKFTTDGKGGGSWSSEVPKNFKAMRVVQQAATVSINKTAYMVGGLASGWTDPDQKGEQAVGGMIKYDFDAKAFINDTEEWSPIDSTIQGGRAEFLPGFGKNGLVVLLGGMQLVLTPDPVHKRQQNFDFHNISLFDPVSQKRYWQIATGEVPLGTPRHDFCAASQRTADGGQEILIAGGMNPWGQDEAHVDAYILSLPGFFWTRVPDLPFEPRRFQTCVAVGKRQVLSIGGEPGGVKIDKIKENATVTDPAPQGLMLFDMTDLKWKFEYNANDGPYERPDVIKNWYKNGSFANVQWQSPEVKALFIESPKTEPGQDTTGGTGGSDPSGTSPGSSDKPVAESSGPSTGAIAGGVVGGVAGLALIAAAVWFFLIRAKRNTTKDQEGLEYVPPPLPNKDYYTAQHPELPNGWQGNELPAYREERELSAVTRPVELPHMPAELPDQRYHMY